MRAFRLDIFPALCLPLAVVLSFWAASPARAVDLGDLSGLEACLADQARVVEVFAERFPHEACSPLSACDPKLVTSAEVIATRNCRQEAIGYCTDGDATADCLGAILSRWADMRQGLRQENTARIESLELTALPKLVQRRLSQAEVRGDGSCPSDPVLVQAVLGRAEIGARTCEVFEMLTDLEATEATARYIDGVVAR